MIQEKSVFFIFIMYQTRSKTQKETTQETSLEKDSDKKLERFQRLGEKIPKVFGKDPEQGKSMVD
jgi:hypothetical protein